MPLSIGLESESELMWELIDLGKREVQALECVRLEDRIARKREHRQRGG